MGRWEPNAQARLRQAAMDLYAERGFDQTTVAEIAEKAGLTERTFFRHFGDKREVLFGGSERLQEMLVASVTAADPGTDPAVTVAAAFEHAAEDYFPPVGYSRQRQQVIDANPGLQERELAKLDGLAAAMAAALRERETPDLPAALIAETGVAAFKVAFVRWVTDPADAPLLGHVRSAFAALGDVWSFAPGRI
ncbi:TetR family transcriptional regulator [Actinoplanes solisilvae]|uniref:TetR family transcriptional regulator n=1 Tax=Actinoplanes solisilvae TaxID=2486853 RepID=UPI000FD9AB2A|nr:TetR family transcriptional regulator [Actinoplanes solisilvae]